MNVFIVDDETILHMLYEELLLKEGHGVSGNAYDGKEAVEKIMLMKEKPDIVLMDQRMPEKSGLDATKELLVEIPELSIVFVTADENIIEKALKSGAKDFIIKPFDTEEFIRVINRQAL